MVDSRLIATTGDIRFLLWTAGCTIGEYKRFICLKYGGYRKSADRNSGCVMCLEQGKAIRSLQWAENYFAPREQGKVGLYQSCK